MNTTTKIDLPLFTGFYESIHSFDFEYIIEDLLQGLENGENYYNINESDIKRIKESKYKYCEASEVFYDYCDINNTEYKRGYSKEYTSNFKDIFSEILKELWISRMDFVKVCSPREYNFATDTIEVEIEYSFKALMDYIKNNEVAFSGYIKDNNTSYDGFCAFWDNKFSEYLKKESFKEFEVTQIIDFAIQKYKSEVDGSENDFNIELYYKTSENIYANDYIINIKK